MTGMFENCNNLENLNFLKNWNTSNVINMSHMFKGCYSLESLESPNN